MGFYQRWIVPRLIDLAMGPIAWTPIAGGQSGRQAVWCWRSG